MFNKNNGLFTNYTPHTKHTKVMYTPLKKIINGRQHILKKYCKIKYIIYYMRKLQIMFLLYIVNRLRLKMYFEIKLSKLKN
jgi:hypothetical protein